MLSASCTVRWQIFRASREFFCFSPVRPMLAGWSRRRRRRPDLPILVLIRSPGMRLLVSKFSAAPQEGNQHGTRFGCRKGTPKGTPIFLGVPNFTHPLMLYLLMFGCTCLTRLPFEKGHCFSLPVCYGRNGRNGWRDFRRPIVKVPFSRKPLLGLSFILWVSFLGLVVKATRKQARIILGGLPDLRRCDLIFSGVLDL